MRRIVATGLNLTLWFAGLAAGNEPTWPQDVDQAQQAIERGSFLVAETYLDLASHIARKEGSADLRLSDAYESLAQSYGQTEQPDKAVGALRNSITICRDTIGANQPKVASLLRDLALLEEELGQFAEAEQVRVEEVKVLENRFGDGHPAVAKAIERLAAHYAERSMADEADENFRRALDILGASFGLASPALHTTMEAYIGFLKQDGRHSDAVRLEAARRQLDGSAPSLSPGPDVEFPRLLEQVEPQYSEEAREKKVSGRVELSMIVDEQGKPSDLWVIGPLGFGLDEKALEAIAKWRFEPATKDGLAVPFATVVEVGFRLL
jgi:TonB family protein